MRAPALAALAAFAALAPFTPARADFEGLLVYKMSGEMTGTGRTSISRAGARSEMEMRLPEAQQAEVGEGQMSIRMVTIVKSSEPNRVYFVNDDQKSYHVFEQEPGAHAIDDAKYTVKKLGKDTVAGFSCEDVSVTSSRGDELEMCVSRAVMSGWDWLRALEVRAGKRANGLFTALGDAGVKGFPVRVTSKRKGGKGGFAMELVSAEQRSVPASTFAIPAGYTKTDSMSIIATSDAQQELREAMKKMSPEQRRQMEEMVKQYRTGK